MQRYFIDEPISEEDITLSGENAVHIARVMRMKRGNSIICCGPDGRCAQCRILQLAGEQVTVSVIEELDCNELPVRVTLAQALPKGDKLDWIVQKGTELGAETFFPFASERSIVKWDANKREKKAIRLQKVAKEAAQQSQRNHIPKVCVPGSMQQLLDLSREFDVKMIAYEEEAKTGKNSRLATVLQRMKASDSVLLVIGPEGGLAEQEVKVFENDGFIVCGLGPRILRTETAGLYVLAAISYQFE